MDEHKESRPQPARIGFAFSLLAALSFGIMGFLVHASAGRIPSGELTFLRGAFSWVVLLPFSLRYITLAFSRQSTYLWLRSAAGATSMVCFFWNLQHTNVGTASALSNLAPVLVALLSWQLLRERLDLREGLAVAITVSGALTLYRHSGQSLPLIVIIVGLAGALTTSIAYLSLRQAALRFTPELVVWCLSTLTMLAAAIAPGEPWVRPSAPELAPIGGVMVAGLLGQVFMTRAYVHLRAPVASALGLSSLVWGVLCEVIFHRDYPSALEWLSYALIIAGVALLQLASERRARREN